VSPSSLDVVSVYHPLAYAVCSAVELRVSGVAAAATLADRDRKGTNERNERGLYVGEGGNGFVAERESPCGEPQMSDTPRLIDVNGLIEKFSSPHSRQRRNRVNEAHFIKKAAQQLDIASAL